MAMRRLRVLLICYYFPPVGGAGVSRPLGLMKYLPGHGIDCDILTVKPIAYRVMEPELLEGLDEARIHRAGSTDPLRLLYLAGLRRLSRSSTRRARSTSRRIFPDSKVGWVRRAVKLGSRLLETGEYDAVISTSPPISCHLIAKELVHRTGLPWIADFRDPWTSYTIENWYSDAEMIDRARALLEAIRSGAASITGANESIVDYLGGGVAIPTGFDPHLARLWRPPEKSDRFVIGVLGTIDSLTPMTPLLQLLDTVRERSSDTIKRIAIRHVGRLDDPDVMTMIAKHGFAGRFESHGVRDRRSTIELLSDCALMYLGIAPGRAEILTPGRVFDLIASGRPIIAHAAESSELARIVISLGHGHCFQATDRAGIEAAAQYVIEQVENLRSGSATITPQPAYAEPYSMPVTMARFAALVRDLAG